MSRVNGQVFWIFGLSGAGKSTLATALIEKLRNKEIPVLPLDGDALRTGLCRGLGFSDQDRTENLRRAAEVARLAADSGISVVASFITPLESQRALVRKTVGNERIFLIFADAPLEVCQRRDVKGLYARAQAGHLPQMTGMGSLFETPIDANLILQTDQNLPADSARALIAFASNKFAPTRTS